MHGSQLAPFSEDQQSLTRKSLEHDQILSGQFWGELRVFLAVAKAKSFNRAAEILNTSQPTVSRQVKRLQDLMGSQLFVPTDEGVLHIISLFAYCQFRALINPALPPSHSLLTYREREALRWVSIGKSDWDISTILHISKRTARAHVENAMHKLKAVNRTAAVTEALSRGEIPLNF
jgi:DNA-binding CsgD family transcriptional regulator